MLYNNEGNGCNVAHPTQNQYVWRIDYNRFLYQYFQCLSYLQFNLKYSFFPEIVFKRGYKENNKNNNHLWAQRFAIQWEKQKSNSICAGYYVQKKNYCSSLLIVSKINTKSLINFILIHFTFHRYFAFYINYWNMFTLNQIPPLCNA